METQFDTDVDKPTSVPRWLRSAQAGETPRESDAAAFDAAVLAPAQAAMAIVSRCANHTLSQQLENAYSAARQARDLARGAAAVIASDCRPGPAREALITAWARQEADAERLMDAILRFGREHGHLAFAFPVGG
jgi:hypothetical protein